MSYTPTEWESTDVVTATRMNALEQAVGDMNMSYTPNTWSDGDILSADKMNALEQAVASGGGGSSDFSTATVTITNSSSVGVNIYVPFISAYDEFVTISSLSSSEAMQVTVVLHNGSAGFFTDEGRTLSATGDIELPPFPIPACTITGDGTITIS